MNEALKNDLIARAKVDQDMRNRAIKSGISGWDSSVDEDNTAFMETIINKVGWPKISEVGKEASQCAWLLIQHADHNPAFQSHCLERMKALPVEEVAARNIAYLEDRVRVGSGLPQLYGTQFIKVKDTFVPQPIEDESNLEKRRAKMGLEPFAVNLQLMIDTYS